MAAVDLPAGRISRVDVLRPASAVPAHLASRFDRRALFAELRDRTTVVLDRRAHGLFTIDPTGRTVRRVVDAGWEPGRLLDAEALAVAPNDIIGVLDSPQGFDRVQYFGADGLVVGSFYLPQRATPRLSVENTVVDAPSALAFTGQTFLVNQPDWGTAFAEFNANGSILRQVGRTRSLHAGDADVARAMNVGIPLVDPGGGFYFVFQNGTPIFRRYDRAGALIFERHIEGVELDARLLAMPTTWADRTAGTKPVVPPLVRAAAVDRDGHLWVSLAVPYTYVYDRTGEKIRTVQFHTTEIVAPTFLFFTARGELLMSPGGYRFEP
jgi:hypothetical protein